MLMNDMIFDGDGDDEEKNMMQKMNMMKEKEDYGEHVPQEKVMMMMMMKVIKLYIYDMMCLFLVQKQTSHLATSPFANCHAPS